MFALALFAGFLVVWAAVSLAVVTVRPARSRRARDLAGRITSVGDAAVTAFGRHLGALAVVLAGWAAVIVVCWPFGRMARRFAPQVDQPLLRLYERHIPMTGTWHQVNSVLTQLGNRPEIKIVTVVAAIGFGVLWRRHRWWVPALALAAAFGFEKFGQAALTAVVARPTPPLPDIGGYPSGGCARAAVTYGMVVALALATWPRQAPRWRIPAYCGVALLAVVEGYTRIELFKHWSMDVVGGWLYGGLLLSVLVFGLRCLTPAPAPGSDGGSAAASPPRR